MFIQTEDTPNPASLKFIPGREVMPEGMGTNSASGTAQFSTIDEASSSPLARRLFAVDGVAAVFFGSDFIAITKADSHDWFTIKPGILAAIMEHYASGMPIMDNANIDNASIDDNVDASDAGADSETIQQIKHLLDTRVRPAVAMDGGDIVFKSFENGVVTLYMRGACAGCPSAGATLKMGIENLLRHYIPEVQEVQADELV